MKSQKLHFHHTYGHRKCYKSTSNDLDGNHHQKYSHIQALVSWLSVMLSSFFTPKPELANTRVAGSVKLSNCCNFPAAWEKRSEQKATNTGRFLADLIIQVDTSALADTNSGFSVNRGKYWDHLGEVPFGRRVGHAEILLNGNFCC